LGFGHRLIEQGDVRPVARRQGPESFFLDQQGFGLFMVQPRPGRPRRRQRQLRDAGGGIDVVEPGARQVHPQRHLALHQHHHLYAAGAAVQVAYQNVRHVQLDHQQFRQLGELLDRQAAVERAGRRFAERGGRDCPPQHRADDNGSSDPGDPSKRLKHHHLVYLPSIMNDRVAGRRCRDRHSSR